LLVLNCDKALSIICLQANIYTTALSIIYIPFKNTHLHTFHT
jgi:hypothetical protein